MGETIVMNVTGSYFCWIAFAIGGISLFIYLLIRYIDPPKEITKTGFAIWLIASLMILGAGVAIHRTYDIPMGKANYEVAMDKLQAIQATYQDTSFFLKEEVSEPGTWGEVKAAVGGFLVFSGKIYGSIDSGRVVTVVYEDNDPVIDPYVGVHRSVSFQLDQAVIETIPTGEQPYLMYPEARIDLVRNEDFVGGQLILTPGTPHLYLPEGWQIL